MKPHNGILKWGLSTIEGYEDTTKDTCEKWSYFILYLKSWQVKLSVKKRHSIWAAIIHTKKIPMATKEQQTIAEIPNYVYKEQVLPHFTNGRISPFLYKYDFVAVIVLKALDTCTQETLVSKVIHVYILNVSTHLRMAVHRRKMDESTVQGGSTSGGSKSR